MSEGNIGIRVVSFISFCFIMSLYPFCVFVSVEKTGSGATVRIVDTVGIGDKSEKRAEEI
jgi:hypothetical protein